MTRLSVKNSFDESKVVGRVALRNRACSLQLSVCEPNALHTGAYPRNLDVTTTCFFVTLLGSVDYNEEGGVHNVDETYSR